MIDWPEYLLVLVVAMSFVSSCLMVASTATIHSAAGQYYHALLPTVKVTLTVTYLLTTLCHLHNTAPKPFSGIAIHVSMDVQHLR